MGERYKLTIASAALDEHPDVLTFDTFYEMQDCLIERAAEVYGDNYSEQDFEEFMTLVNIEEINNG